MSVGMGVEERGLGGSELVSRVIEEGGKDLVTTTTTGVGLKRLRSEPTHTSTPPNPTTYTSSETLGTSLTPPTSSGRPQRERRVPDKFVPSFKSTRVKLGGKGGGKRRGGTKPQLKSQSQTQTKSKVKRRELKTTEVEPKPKPKLTQPKTKPKVTQSKAGPQPKRAQPTNHVTQPRSKRLKRNTSALQPPSNLDSVGYPSDSGESSGEELETYEGEGGVDGEELGSNLSMSEFESVIPEVNEEVFMEMGGLTEGCFTLLPCDSEPTTLDSKTFPFRPLLSNREPLQAAEIRYSHYQAELNQVELISQKQLFQTQQQSFDSIISHLNSRFASYLETKRLLLETDPSKRERFFNSVTGSQCLELLVVRHGSNRSDANPLYDHLMGLLSHPEPGPFQFDTRVADIQKTTLNPGLDTILRTLFCDWLLPQTPTNLESRFRLDLGSLKAFPYDMSIFCNWYTQYQTQHSPSNNPTEQEIFVLLFRDYQLLDSKTLQDLIRILSQYRPFLPIWVILGASASPISLESLLAQDSLSMVSIQTFDLVDPHRSLLELIEQVFIYKKHGLKLNNRTFQLLLDTFVDYTHSLNTFLASYKYALMDHFYSNPLSILVCDSEVLPSENLHGLWDKRLVLHEHCELIRMQPSFQAYIKLNLGSDKFDVRLALEDDTYLVQIIMPPLLDRIHTYHESYSIFFGCLISFQEWVGANSINHSSKLHPAVSLYSSNLEMDIVNLPFFDSVLKSFISAAIKNPASLINFLERTAERIKSAPEPKSHIDAPSPQEYFKKLVAIRNQLKNLPEVSVDYSKKLAGFFKGFFRLFLPSYKSLPLHEPFYYSNIELLEKTFNPQPQAALEYALTRPRVYLPTPASREGGAPPLPDSAIAYRIYKEAGRLINLFDWLKTFEHLVIKQHYKQDARAKPPTPIDIQARFAQCLNELKFLGYIQPTQRKTDHVQKLTWN